MDRLTFWQLTFGKHMVNIGWNGLTDYRHLSSKCNVGWQELTDNKYWFMTISGEWLEKRSLQQAPDIWQSQGKFWPTRTGLWIWVNMLFCYQFFHKVGLKSVDLQSVVLQSVGHWNNKRKLYGLYWLQNWLDLCLWQTTLFWQLSNPLLSVINKCCL